MKILGNKVLLSPLPPKQVLTAGGLFVHPSYMDDALQWRVLAVGPGQFYRGKKGQRVFLSPEVAPGDRVLCDTGLGGVALADGSWIVDARQIAMKW